MRAVPHRTFGRMVTSRRDRPSSRTVDVSAVCSGLAADSRTLCKPDMHIIQQLSVIPLLF